eukprot:TRINITY_DN0_c24_g1_i9.p1 TRINITY_DN0_c24_g1~~TRINITY_DN0_c24_g1_i9.p1  ORF type:complete len:106 (+),score=3.63 TRINITY_DN0_c24_g1_i9:2-319(+)
MCIRDRIRIPKYIHQRKQHNKKSQRHTITPQGTKKSLILRSIEKKLDAKYLLQQSLKRCSSAYQSSIIKKIRCRIVKISNKNDEFKYFERIQSSSKSSRNKEIHE